MSRLQSILKHANTLTLRVRGRVRISDNRKMSDREYAVACKLCDIVAEVLRVGQQSLPGGIFWGEIKDSPAHTIFRRKNRLEMDHSILLNNRFRDFPTVIYDHARLTPKPDFWVLRYLQLCAAVPRRWHVRIPPRFGEIGWKVRGFPVNRHTAFLQERINAQLHLGMDGILSGPSPCVFEIGGGAGEMGHTICKAVPSVSWYNCDLSQSLIYNAIHMAVWFPRKRHYIYVGNLAVSGLDERYLLRSAKEASLVRNAVVHIPHFLLPDFEGHLKINLALNAWSFSEMPKAEVERYAGFIQRNLADGGALIEQNGVHAERGGCNAKEIIEGVFAAHQPCDVDRIMGGPIDRWSDSAIPTSGMVDIAGFSHNDAVPDLAYSPEHYTLLQDVLGDIKIF